MIVTRGGNRTGIQWIEDKDAAKYTMCRIVPTTKNYLVPSVSLAAVEKPALNPGLT